MNKDNPVIFVGAGPGDPGLLTIRGRDAIEAADVVIYTGSLVPPEIVALAANNAATHDSASMTLEDCHALIAGAHKAGKSVVRLHTGDPSLYGALREQAELLDASGIPWIVIPGVTAACAAAAAAGISFTNPEIGQSLIITRRAGRTPMPPNESLTAFGRHATAMAIYLSAKMARDAQDELLQSLPPETPVACGYRIGWPDGKVVWTVLGGLADCVEANGLQRQTVFLVLPGYGENGCRSRLYDPEFSHSHRSGRQP